MIAFTGPNDKQMLKHTAEVMGDRIHSEGGYTQGDSDVVDGIDHMGHADTSVVVLTGEECAEDEAKTLLRQVVEAELRHWVPGASQRLIYRAANALGFKQPYPLNEDCGPEPGQHSLVGDYIAGLRVMRCASCLRAFAA